MTTITESIPPGLTYLVIGYLTFLGTMLVSFKTDYAEPDNILVGSLTIGILWPAALFFILPWKIFERKYR